MTYLAIYVLTTSTFAQLLRFGQRRGATLATIVAVNYVVAFCVTSAWSTARYSAVTGNTLTLVALGLTNGVLYFVHLLVVLAAFRLVGVGIAIAVYTTANVTPVFVAWALWGDVVSTPQWVAVALLPFAVFLMRPATPPTADRPFATLKADLVLFLGFAMAGVITTIHKAAEVYGTGGDRPAYNVSLFAAAAVSSVAYAVWRRRRATRFEMRLGAVVGAINSANLILLLLSLTYLDTAVVFPVSTCLVIIVNMVGGRILWGEVVRRHQMIGVVLALAVVCLTNID